MQSNPNTNTDEIEATQLEFQEATYKEVAAEALEEYLNGYKNTNQNDRYQALRDVIATWKMPAWIMQEALLNWAIVAKEATRAYKKNPVPNSTRADWVYIWSKTSCSGTTVIWGGSSVDLRNLPLLLGSWGSISLWAKMAMPNGPLDLPLLDATGGSGMRTYEYKAPKLPAVENGLPVLKAGMADEIEMTFQDVIDWQNKSGACDEGTVEFFRSIGVHVDVEHSWDGFDGCVNCASEDPCFDYDEELGIESIQDIEDFTFTRDNLDDIPSEHSQYREGLEELFLNAGGQWEDAPECIKAVQEANPDIINKKGILSIGATFKADILGHIEALDLDDWDNTELMELALSLNAMVERFYSAGYLPPIKGTLDYLGDDWEFDGTEFKDYGMTLAHNGTGWTVNGHEVHAQPTRKVVFVQSRGRDAEVGHSLDNMNNALRMG